jgi:hypothetical protein
VVEAARAGRSPESGKAKSDSATIVTESVSVLLGIIRQKLSLSIFFLFLFFLVLLLIAPLLGARRAFHIPHAPQSTVLGGKLIAGSFR